MYFGEMIFMKITLVSLTTTNVSYKVTATLQCVLVYQTLLH